MSFDEVDFPVRVEYGSLGGVQFCTEVVAIDSGFERRNQKWAQARRRFDARSGVVTFNDAAILVSFFQARAGRARGFRLKDWADFSTAANGVDTPSWEDQVIAVGDGVEDSFQLIKTYGLGEVTYERTLRKPVEGSVSIGVNGTEYETGWSVDESTGVITFSQAPACGAIIKAGCLFDVPVRFDTDVLTISYLNGNLSETEIPIIEVRV
jgi:uncharacterized protein (TIGR02217 family)